MKINLKQLYSNKKPLLGIVFLVLIVGFTLLYFKIAKHKNILDIKLHNTTEELVSSEGETKKDSLCKFGFCADENIVVTDDAPVRRTANYAKFNSVYNLKFGTVIYTKNIDQKNKGIKIDKSLLEKERRTNYVAIYALKPIFISDKPVGYMLEDDFVQKIAFKDYVPKPKEELPLILETSIKNAIDENLKIDNSTFQYAKESNRFNKSVIYGDFNNDGKQDFAVVLDNPETVSSGLFVYFKNKDSNRYDLIYTKSFALLATVKTIGKQTKVVINKEMTSFPLDGFQITTTDLSTFFYVFNDESKLFMVFPN